MKKIIVCLVTLVFLFQRCDTELVDPLQSQRNVSPQASKELFNQTLANTIFVSTTGNDNAEGSADKPWRTLKHAASKVPANQGYTIQLSAGTFVESGLVEIPLGVSILGAGVDKTILKAASSFHYNPSSPGYSLDKFLISLNESSEKQGNQILKNFTIDGDSKKLHGGIYVRNRNNVIIEHVKVQNTNFTGIWLWDMKDAKVKNTQLINCSWGSNAYCVGALNIGNLERVEIDQLDVDENTGYGIKAIGPNGNNSLIDLKIHDSRISVHPVGLWNNGGAPNIAIELWQVNLVGSEIYNTYVDNTISLINSNATPSTGKQTIRVHHNIIDMEARANGAGYGVELTLHDAEIDHNYFIKGKYGIANWDHAMQNWDIHHNTFYALEGVYPGEVVRSQKNGLHNVKLYNNTIEFAGNKTMNVVGLYGGSSTNIDIKNNLFINSNTGYNYYQNKLVHMENGASLNTLTVNNNLFWGLSIGDIEGGVYQNNLTSDPLISKQGDRPGPYYMPAEGSPLINAGVNVGYSHNGSAPNIGAWESNSNSTTPPVTPPPVVPPPVIPPPVNPPVLSDMVSLYINSYEAKLSGKMVTGVDPNTVGGAFFYIPPGTGRNHYIPPPGVATFSFDVPKTDKYVIWVKVMSPTLSNQTYSVYDGKGKWRLWRAGLNPTWTWVKITERDEDVHFDFTEGLNQFKMGWRDDNVKVNQVLITNDLSFVP